MILMIFLSPVGHGDLPDVPFMLWTPNSSRTSRSACSGSRRVARCGAVSWTWRSCSARLATLHSCPRPAMAARRRLHSTTGRLSCAPAFATRCARRAMRWGGAPPAAGVTPTVPHLLEERVGPAGQWASAAWLASDRIEPLPLLRQVWPQLGPSNPGATRPCRCRGSMPARPSASSVAGTLWPYMVGAFARRWGMSFATSLSTCTPVLHTATARQSQTLRRRSAAHTSRRR